LASVIVATSELKEVRSVIDAMRRADIESALAIRHRCDCFEREAEFCPRQKIHPEPVIEPRRHLHPEPKIEPRVRLHPRAAVVPPVAEGEHHERKTPFVQPPWKVLPYPANCAATVKVKVVLNRPDIIHKGTLLDFFC
jgi:hypothetical protein